MKPNHLLIFLLIFWSCKSEEPQVLTNIEGAYIGQFYLAVPNSDFVSSDITLTLENGRFSGTSSRSKYPAICRGTYEIIGDEIIFTDECIWTAEFNWGLILSGNFKFSLKDGKLSKLTRKEGENSYVYNLSKTN
ncbi:hypothetical protein [Algoriphagus marinus]|uniref:hypothetical protein n=1 Tax=Algoriphagus marinus TaxID=1925762 RepID=UPI00094B8C03|nr:hypothetical protein [Algoriphagus marinus]